MTDLAAPGASEELGTFEPAPEETVVAETGETLLGEEAVDVAPATFDELGPGALPSPERDLRLLNDVKVELAVELGRCRLPLRDLLRLTPGSVVDLDRSADTPVDVIANGTVVARGELVDVEGEWGVRILHVAPER